MDSLVREQERDQPQANLFATRVSRMPPVMNCEADLEERP